MSTDKGHMQQTINNIKSTNQQEPKKLKYPTMKPLVQRTNTVFTNIIYHKMKIATDFTSKLPVTSNRGNKYLFVLHDYDRNCILVRPMKSRVDSDFI